LVVRALPSRQAAARPGVQAAASSCPAASMGDEHADHGHDVHFESADAGASLTYPQQAGTVRKNGFLVIKSRPCKVRPPVAPAGRSPALCGRVAGARPRTRTTVPRRSCSCGQCTLACAHSSRSRLLSARAALDCGSCMCRWLMSRPQRPASTVTPSATLSRSTSSPARSTRT